MPKVFQPAADKLSNYRGVPMKKFLSKFFFGAGIATIIVASGQGLVGLVVMDILGLLMIAVGLEIQSSTEV